MAGTWYAGCRRVHRWECVKGSPVTQKPEVCMCEAVFTPKMCGVLRLSGTLWEQNLCLCGAETLTVGAR